MECGCTVANSAVGCGSVVYLVCVLVIFDSGGK